MAALTTAYDNIIVQPGSTETPLNTKTKNKSEESTHLLELLKSGNFANNRKELTKNFSKITPQELQEVLASYFEDLSGSLGKDPFKAVDQLSNLIPFEKLQEAVSSDQKSALMKAKAMLHQAKYFLHNRKTKASPTLKAKLSNILDSIINFIESILHAFGVADFFKPASTTMQKEFKFQKIMMLVTFFSMVSTLIVPLVGAAIAAPIVAGTLLFIGVLSVIYPKIAPVPSHLPFGAKNWSKECQNGKFSDLSFTKGRKEILDEMANTLISSQKGKIKKHPLLTGESRVGKTQTAKAFVQAIERGDYPELKGKKVFYISTPKLCKAADFFDGKDPLDQIVESIGRHKEDIILVMDEIHVAFKGDKYSLMGQKLKDMLDAGGDLPYVIGITTSKEFVEYKMDKDEAFVNRFHPIKIESTGPEVTQEILTHSILESGESILLEKDALQMIYDKTKSKPQPYTSDLILKKCIQMTSKKQKPAGKKKLQKLKNTREFLASKGIAAPLNFDGQDDTFQIEKLEEEIASLEMELKNEKKQLDQLFQAKDKISKTKARTYRTVLKMENVKGSKLSKSKKEDLNAFMLMTKFLSPALEQHVKKRAKELGVKMVIDESVISEAVLVTMPPKKIKWTDSDET